MSDLKHYTSWATVFLFVALLAGSGWADELKVGAVSIDITPTAKVYMAGWLPYRVSQDIADPLTANIIAMEAISNKGKTETAIIISFDLISIRSGLMLPLRNAIRKELPEIKLDNILFCATHTHCAPVLNDSPHAKKVEGIMQPSQYVASIIPKVVDGIRTAWQKREKAKFSYGLGQAVVAYNRITVYKDGTTKMYGNTNTDKFQTVESVEDHDVGSMFFWNEKDQLLAMVVNVSCPSQKNERGKGIEKNVNISPDYWGKVRKMIHEKYGHTVVVAGLCGAGGDVSPHQGYQQQAHERMSNLRKISGVEEAARRIVAGVNEVYEEAFSDRKSDVVFKRAHTVLKLPQRIPTKEEYEKAVAVNKKRGERRDTIWSGNAKLIARYERLKDNPKPTFSTPINVLRIGQAALCTNQFEFYTEFGIRIKARSKANQTFVVQLCNGAKNFPDPENGIVPDEEIWGSAGTYLPTERALPGGAYGSTLQQNIVGPEGGALIVENTLKMIEQLWSN